MIDFNEAIPHGEPFQISRLLDYATTQGAKPPGENWIEIERTRDVQGSPVAVWCRIVVPNWALPRA
jgi:hypothetical protein